MTLISYGELVGSSLPNRKVIHKTDLEQSALECLYIVVTPILSPYFIGCKVIDIVQIECIHRY